MIKSDIYTYKANYLKDFEEDFEGFKPKAHNTT